MPRSIAAILIVPLVVVFLSCGGSDEGDADATADSLAMSVEDQLPVEPPVTAPEPRPIQPGYIRARHILISWMGTGVRGVARTRDEASELMTSIQDAIHSGEATFEEMAFLHSDCTTASDSGLLPDFTEGAMVQEFETAAFNTASGEISGVIETSFGFHLIKRL